MTDLIRKSDVLAIVKPDGERDCDCTRCTCGDEVAVSLFDQAKRHSEAIAALPAVTVGVKPLVWEKDKDADSEDFGALVARSPTVHLRYIVRKVYGGGWKLTGAVPFGQPIIDTLEAAQAAAQADYTARILAALTPTPVDTSQTADPAAYNRGYEDCLYQRGEHR